jgi:hypothetical protein
MFFNELTPIVKELMEQPAAFLGGFLSGVFRLNLADDPVKSWLDEQAGAASGTTATTSSENGRTSSL